MKRIIIFATLVICLAALGVGSMTFVPLQRVHAGPYQSASSSPDIAVPDSVQVLRKNVDELVGIVDQQDARTALQALSSRMKTDPLILKNCHAIAHEIGHEAYKKYGDFIVALKQQSSVCSDGYLHGLLEQILADAPNEKALLAEMQSLCAKAGPAAGRCYHGIGHGLMFHFENDLPKALSVCNSYQGFMRGRCDEGVFMQNFLSDPDQPLTVHASKYLDPNDPFFPCATEPSRLKPYCYFYAPIYFLGQHNDDYAAALQWCTTAEKAGIVACVRGVGSLAMKYSVDDPKDAEAICDQARHDLIPYCVDGLVSYHLTFSFNAKKTEAMCDLLESKNQLACNWALERRTSLVIE